RLYHRRHHAAQDGRARAGQAQERRPQLSVPRRGASGDGQPQYGRQPVGKPVRRQSRRHDEPPAANARRHSRRAGPSRTAHRRKEEANMNAAPAWVDWAAWLGRLALGSAAIVALTAVITRRLRSAGWQRTLWRGGMLGLAVF